MSTNTTDAEAIHEWAEAVNSGNTQLAVSLATEDVSIKGPRGMAIGSQALIDWIERTEIFIEILQVSRNGDDLIAECAATWASDEGVPSRTFPVSMNLVFGVSDGHISSIRRLDSLEDLHRESETLSS